MLLADVLDSQVRNESSSIRGRVDTVTQGTHTRVELCLNNNTSETLNRDYGNKKGNNFLSRVSIEKSSRYYLHGISGNKGAGVHVHSPMVPGESDLCRCVQMTLMIKVFTGRCLISELLRPSGQKA